MRDLFVFSQQNNPQNARKPFHDHYNPHSQPLTSSVVFTTFKRYDVNFSTDLRYAAVSGRICESSKKGGKRKTLYMSALGTGKILITGHLCRTFMLHQCPFRTLLRHDAAHTCCVRSSSNFLLLTHLDICQCFFIQTGEDYTSVGYNFKSYNPSCLFYCDRRHCGEKNASSAQHCTPCEH